MILSDGHNEKRIYLIYNVRDYDNNPHKIF